MLGKLPVPGRPAILITVGQGPTALAVGAGGGCLDRAFKRGSQGLPMWSKGIQGFVA